MLGSLCFLGCIVGVATVLGILVYFSRDLPDYRQLEKYEPLMTTRLYASDGQLLAEYASERRVFVPVSAMPKRVIHAFLSAEDKNFYSHGGLDFQGIVRAIVTNVKNYGKKGNLVGASTITQQVAKNFLLSSEQSYTRKIKEALLARRIEQTFDKDHILELYLNQIFLGLRSYGVAAAAMTYFDKSLDELELHEIALLAGLPKGPSAYNPKRNPTGALERRNYVLDRMFVNGYITEQEMLDAKEKPIVLTERKSGEAVQNAEYYSEEVRRLIEAKYGEEALYHGGLSVRTSLDPHLQQIGVKALFDGLLNYDQRHGYRGVVAHIDSFDNLKEDVFDKYIKPEWYPEKWETAVVSKSDAEMAHLILSEDRKGAILLKNLKWAKKALPDGKVGEEIMHPSEVLKKGDVIYVQLIKADNEPPLYRLRQYPQAEGALVVLDPHTGRVLAMVGGSSFKKSQFNRAVQAERQPGSSFKPFVYMTALDSGFTPSSLILDAPLVLDQGPGQPKWKPINYTKIFYGPSTLRTGIEKSRNLMTIRLAQAVGIEKTVEYAKKFGISDKLLPVLSMSLGSGETTLLKMTSAYAMIVNGGKKITPNLIDRIQDRKGLNVYKHDMRPCEKCQENASKDELPVIPDTREQIEDPVTAYQMVNIMTGVVLRGTGAIAQTVQKTLAGKSGTSNDNVDTWFIGFSPDLVVGVWVGHDEPKTLGPKDTGGAVAAPIFRDFMREALKNKPDTPFRIPEGVRLVRVN
ncbi:MAG: penicillin-binding protein 1A, partial [Alphaproteobacteria bacterium]|nr:penicillin-binding protein 1A [Alphaproteobacteria bacterium]